MEEEDDENDDGEDSEEESEEEEDDDDDDDDADKKVETMQQNQQQYIQMCSSSAQILQLLSRFIPPGKGASGQVMTLMNLTDDSEDSAQEPEEESSSVSSAMSDNNAESVIWAEPLMTCELAPTYYNDVRRLPRGVKPEDIKNKRHADMCRQNSQKLRAAANRLKYFANRNAGKQQSLSTPKTSSSSNTNTLDSTNVDCSGSSATERHRLNGDEQDFHRNHAAFEQAVSKISAATETIKRARNILAMVGNGRQTNNNNNPDVSGDNKSDNSETKNSKVNSSEDRSKANKSVKTESETNELSESASIEDKQCRSKSVSLHISNGCASNTCFPEPILVKAVLIPSDQLKEKNDQNTREQQNTMPSADDSQNNQLTNRNIPYLCVKNSDTAGPSSQSMSNSTLPQCHDANKYAASGLLQPSRVSGQLYRYPSINCTAHCNNRTHQVVSLGSTQAKSHVAPPPVDLPIGPPPANLPIVPPPSANREIIQKLIREFKAFNKVSKAAQGTNKQTITLDHLKISLEIAWNKLKEIGIFEQVENNGTGDENMEARNSANLVATNRLNGYRWNAESGLFSPETAQDLHCDAEGQENVAECFAANGNTLRNSEITTDENTAEMSVAKVDSRSSCERTTDTINGTVNDSKDNTLHGGNFITEVENGICLDQLSSIMSLRVEGKTSQDEFPCLEGGGGSGEHRQDRACCSLSRGLSCEQSSADNGKNVQVPTEKNPCHFQCEDQLMSLRKELSAKPDLCIDPKSAFGRQSEVLIFPTTQTESCDFKYEKIFGNKDQHGYVDKQDECTQLKINEKIDNDYKDRKCQSSHKRSVDENSASTSSQYWINQVCKIEPIEVNEFVKEVKSSRPQDELQNAVGINTTNKSCTREEIIHKGENNLQQLIVLKDDTTGSIVQSSDNNQNICDFSPSYSTPDNVQSKEEFSFAECSNNKEVASTNTKANLKRHKFSLTKNRSSQYQRHDKKKADSESRQPKMKLLNHRNLDNSISDHGRIWYNQLVQRGTNETTSAQTREVNSRHDKQEKNLLEVVELSIHSNKNNVNLYGVNIIDKTLDHFTSNNKPVDGLNANEQTVTSNQMRVEMQDKISKQQHTQNTAQGGSSLKKSCLRLRPCSLANKFRWGSKSCKVVTLGTNDEVSDSQNRETALNNLRPSSDGKPMYQNAQLIKNTNQIRTNTIEVCACNEPYRVLSSLEELPVNLSEIENHQQPCDLKETTNKQVIVKSISACTDNLSLLSSLESLDKISLTNMESVAPAKVSSTADILFPEMLSMPEKKEEEMPGIKLRFLRLFARCLQSFGNRN